MADSFPRMGNNLHDGFAADLFAQHYQSAMYGYLGAGGVGPSSGGRPSAAPSLFAQPHGEFVPIQEHLAVKREAETLAIQVAMLQDQLAKMSALVAAQRDATLQETLETAPVGSNVVPVPPSGPPTQRPQAAVFEATRMAFGAALASDGRRGLGTPSFGALGTIRGDHAAESAQSFADAGGPLGAAEASASSRRVGTGSMREAIAAFQPPPGLGEPPGLGPSAAPSEAPPPITPPAASSPRPTVVEEEELELGSLVTAPYCGPDGTITREWYPGKIVGRHTNGTYCVDYEDSRYFWYCAPRDRIRRRQPQRGAPGRPCDSTGVSAIAPRCLNGAGGGAGARKRSAADAPHAATPAAAAAVRVPTSSGRGHDEDVEGDGVSAAEEAMAEPEAADAEASAAEEAAEERPRRGKVGAAAAPRAAERPSAVAAPLSGRTVTFDCEASKAHDDDAYEHCHAEGLGVEELGTNLQDLDVEALLSMIRGGEDDGDMQVRACIALNERLSRTSTSKEQQDSASQQKFALKGASCVLEALHRSGQTSQGLALQGLILLRRLGGSAPGDCNLLVGAHGARAVVDTLCAHAMSASVQNAGCRAIVALSSSAQAARALLVAGAAAAVIAAMGNHPLRVDWRGCHALARMPNDGADEIVRLGGFRAALEVLRRKPHDQQIAKFALRVLQSFVQSPDHAERLCDLGGIVVVLHVMREHQATFDIQSACLALLKSLAVQRDSIAKRIMEYKGINIVLESVRIAAAFEASGGFDVLFVQAMNLLSLLRAPLRNTEELVRDLGGAELILSALQAHPQSDKVQCAGCMLIGLLSSGNLASAQLLFEMGAHTVVIEAMRRHAESVHWLACQALFGLPKSAGQAIMDMGGIGAVLDVVRKTPGEKEVAISALRFCCKFICDTPHLEAFLQQGGVDVVVSEMRALPLEKEVQSKGLKMLKSLAVAQKDAGSCIVDAGGVGAILAAVRSSDDLAHLGGETLIALMPLLVETLKGAPLLEICIQTCEALVLLIRGAPGVRQQITSLPGLKAVIEKVMSNFPAGVALQELGCRVLENLEDEPKSQAGPQAHQTEATVAPAACSPNAGTVLAALPVGPVVVPGSTQQPPLPPPWLAAAWQHHQQSLRSNGTASRDATGEAS